MVNHVYKTIELTGSSGDSVEAAIATALERAGKTIRHMRWFEVASVRGHIDNGKVEHYQVTLKVGFTLEE